VWPWPKKHQPLPLEHIWKGKWSGTWSGQTILTWTDTERLQALSTPPSAPLSIPIHTRHIIDLATLPAVLECRVDDVLLLATRDEIIHIGRQASKGQHLGGRRLDLGKVPDHAEFPWGQQGERTGKDNQKRYELLGQGATVWSHPPPLKWHALIALSRHHLGLDTHRKMPRSSVLPGLTLWSTRTCPSATASPPCELRPLAEGAAAAACCRAFPCETWTRCLAGLFRSRKQSKSGQTGARSHAWMGRKWIQLWTDLRLIFCFQPT